MKKPPEEIRLALASALAIDDDSYRVQLEAAAVEAVEHLQRERSEKTQVTYSYPWDRWLRHCERRAIAPVPVRPEELIVYLTAMSMSGAAPNTVRLAMAAISVTDQRLRTTNDDPNPESVRSSAKVRAWHKGWSKRNPVAPQSQAPAVTPQQLELVIRAAQERPRNVSGRAHVAHYARDRAMLLIGVCAALRVSDLVALELRDVVQDPSGRGLIVYVRRSKNDQEGRGHKRGVFPQARTLRCPVDAWLTWRNIRGDWEGPAFVGINRLGELARVPLEESAARKALSRRAKAAGISFSSHTMRATFVTLGVEQGKSLTKLANQGNWRSLDVLRGYVRQGELFSDDNPTSGLLDD